MKNKKIKFIAVFIGLFLMLSNKVSAKELSDFCSFTSPCLTTEIIDNWISSNNIDTTVYDSYFVTAFKPDNRTYFYITFYSSKLNNIYLTKSGSNYVLNEDSGILAYHRQEIVFNSSVNLNNISLNNQNGFYYTIRNDISTLAYYSNRDIKDQDGNVILKANAEVIEEEPEEEPITIINKMALLVNDIVIYFNENNISFYQILIGLFVFNFLVYVICYIVRRF